jgi:hypothetical protein
MPFNDVMQRTKRLMLRIACGLSIVSCAGLVLRLAGVVPPVGVGWGDAVRGRAYLVKVDEFLVFETASGFRPMPPGVVIAVGGVRQADALGFHYFAWDVATRLADRTPLPGVYGSHAKLGIILAWPILLSLGILLLCLMLLARERRAARGRGVCRNCGYDLRATPERCPECGLIPKTAPATA